MDLPTKKNYFRVKKKNVMIYHLLQKTFIVTLLSPLKRWSSFFDVVQPFLSFPIWTDSVLCSTHLNVFVIHGTFFWCTLLFFALYLVPFIEHLSFVTGSLHFLRPFWMSISTRSVQMVWGVYVFRPMFSFLITFTVCELSITSMMQAFHYFDTMLSRRIYFESKHFSLYLDSKS